MTTLDIFHWFQNTAIGQALGQADHLVGAVLQLLHIAGFLLLLTAVVLANLRLLGVGLKRQSVRRITNASAPLLWSGLAAAIFSGVIIFLSGPVHYYPNEAFWTKLAILLVAFSFQAGIYRKVALSETHGPVAVKTAAVTSLTLWFGVGIAGRAIGFI